jgi:hypothetical protein
MKIYLLWMKIIQINFNYYIIKNAIIINDEFLEWEERDAAHITLMRHCIAGSIAGISEHLTLYPIDTLKTHLQVSGSK